ncbi:semaphorin-6D-like [Petromyzon marinus]|uniref:semaphorin-6D-like n=1 Tax=Petromyzon marinus TaxID=7757 RepID=UPI003F6FA420
MAAPSLCLLLLLAFSRALHAFPADVDPITITVGRDSESLPVFLGEDDSSNSSLNVQLLLQIGARLLIAGRDRVFTVDLSRPMHGAITHSTKLTWMAERQEVDRCLMKGKTEEECHNFIKVVAPRGDGLLFVCGTNAYSPMCRNYQLADLSFTGEQTSGIAKCPFDPRQGGAATFAGERLYSATAVDPLGVDAVVYGSLGPGPPLRSLKLDSKWLKEPVFVRVLEHGQHVYFFFTEIAVELSSMGKVLFSRVARVCKSDAGGSQRVLDGHWSSFVKARLNCSVGGEAPGDAPFYFNELQGVSEVLRIGGRELVLGVFTTPLNSIHGSAVCAFDMEDVASAFQGRYSEQRGPDGPWLAVPEARTPTPRPGACAGEGEAAAFPRSPLLPDEALSFAKTHPLAHRAVAAVSPQPWFVRSGTRYRLTHIAVDVTAGRHGNETVVLLAAQSGVLLKLLLLLPPGGGGAVLLEEAEPYSARDCGERSPRAVRALLVDTERHAVFLAFSSCVLRIPLSHCARHADCKKACLASRDPYCAWSGGTCSRVTPSSHGSPMAEQALATGSVGNLPDCADSVVTSSGAIREPRVSSSPGRVPAGIVWLCLLGAFTLGAALSCVATVCLFRRCRPRRPERPRKPPPAAPAPGAGPGPPGPYARSRLLEELLLEGAARGKVDAVARSAALLVPLMAVGKVDVTALEWAGGLPPPFPRAGGRPLPELAALPTPESTPPATRRKTGGGGGAADPRPRPSPAATAAAAAVAFTVWPQKSAGSDATTTGDPGQQGHAERASAPSLALEELLRKLQETGQVTQCILGDGRRPRPGGRLPCAPPERSGAPLRRHRSRPPSRSPPRPSAWPPLPRGARGSASSGRGAAREPGPPQVAAFPRLGARRTAAVKPAPAPKPPGATPPPAPPAGAPPPRAPVSSSSSAGRAALLCGR